GHARREAALAKASCLLVARNARDGNGGSQQIRVAGAEVCGAVHHLGQDGGRNVEQRQQLLVPALIVNVEQQGATGIGGVREVTASAGEIPQQPGIDRAKRQLPCLGSGPGALHIIKYPADLAGGKVRVEQQSGLVLEDGAATFALQSIRNLLAPGAGAAVLPHDGPVNRFASAPIPQQGGFALIGDADGANVASLEPGFGECLVVTAQRTLPQVIGFMFHPAVLGEMLREFLLTTGYPLALVIEDDDSAAGRSLVKCHQVLCHCANSLRSVGSPANCVIFRCIIRC